MLLIIDAVDDVGSRTMLISGRSLWQMVMMLVLLMKRWWWCWG